MTAELKPSLRLYETGCKGRRTIADAIEVLRNQAEFSDDMRALVHTYDLPLPSGKDSSIVVVVCEKLGWAVSLPTSTNFYAIRATTNTRDEFKISRLNAAVVDADCNVILSDGTKLRAVEVRPTRLPPQDFTPEQMFIVHAAIRFANAEDQCYRHFEPTYFPGIRRIDFSTLPGLELFGLKAFTKFVIDTCGLPVKSRQTIANTLRDCRIITRRHRLNCDVH
jgi:hypothetical protein